MKYGLNVVNQEDEINGGIFEPEEVMKLTNDLSMALKSDKNVQISTLMEKIKDGRV